MSRIKDAKRRLDAAYDAIESLDADLAAGRASGDDHAPQRAELEREVGRCFVALRRLQRQRDERAGEQRATAVDAVSGTGGPATRRSGLPNPLVLVPAGALLLALGVGGGVAVGRFMAFRSPAGSAAIPVTGTAATPADAPSSAVTPAELDALRRAAAREDAPVQGMLQFAHAVLDQGRLDEARRAYDRVLLREPRNVEAITHLGAVLFAEGRVDDALAKVEQALRIEPGYVHAHWDRTQYLFHAKRDYPAAVQAAEAFLQVVREGPDAETIRKLLADARQRATKTPSPPAR